MTSSYDEIYSRFYLRVKDYEITGLDESLAKEMLNGYLKSALSKPMIRRLFQSMAIDDDIEQIGYEMREPVEEYSDKDFVEEVLSLGMVVSWISPRYHSTLLTSQFFGNNEQRFYAQSTQLSEMKQMYEKAQNDLRKLIRDRGYSNAVINGVDT